MPRTLLIFPRVLRCKFGSRANQNQWRQRGPKWIRLAGDGGGGNLEGETKSSGGFNKPKSVNQEKDGRGRHSFSFFLLHPLSPSCFKQISCFQGLSYAAWNPQHEMETFNKAKKSRDVCSSCCLFLLLTRGIWGMFGVVSDGGGIYKPLLWCNICERCHTRVEVEAWKFSFD